MKAPAILNKIQPFVNAVGPMVKEKAPDAMVVVGVIGLAAAGIWACKVTADKVPEILDERDDIIDMIQNLECEEMSEEENQKDIEKSIKKANRACALKLVKAYALPVGLGLASGASVLAGNHIIKTRYAAALAGMQGLQTAYDNYRSRIVDKFGEAADKYAAYGVETVEVEVEETDEKGKTVLTKKEQEVLKDVTDASAHSPYFRFIKPDDALYRECKGSPIYLRNQLEIYEEILNQMYDQGKPIYFNDAMSYIFGSDDSYMSDDGQIVGWYKYDKKNKAMADERISLRIGSIHNHNDETDSDEIWFYIDPNVFGPVRLGR